MSGFTGAVRPPHFAHVGDRPQPSRSSLWDNDRSSLQLVSMQRHRWCLAYEITRSELLKTCDLGLLMSLLCPKLKGFRLPRNRGAGGN